MSLIRFFHLCIRSGKKTQARTRHPLPAKPWPAESSLVCMTARGIGILLTSQAEINHGVVQTTGLGPSGCKRQSGIHTRSGTGTGPLFPAARPQPKTTPVFPRATRSQAGPQHWGTQKDLAHLPLAAQERGLRLPVSIQPGLEPRNRLCSPQAPQVSVLLESCLSSFPLPSPPPPWPERLF